MSWVVISWNETHPINGSTVARSMSIHTEEMVDKLGNALRDCANVENVHVNRYDTEGPIA